jgi:hypothetical protein
MARTISDNFETIALMLKGGEGAIMFFTRTSAERDRGFTDAFESDAFKANEFEAGALMKGSATALSLESDTL